MKVIREEVMRLHNEGLGTNAIASFMNVSSATISYHKNKLGISGIPVQRIPNGRYDWSPIQRMLDEGQTLKEIRGLCGLSKDRLTRAVKSGHIMRKPLPNEQAVEVWIETYNGRKTYSSFHRIVTKRLVEECDWAYECSICFTVEWAGKRLVLHLDHIDGNPLHNTIENYRLLCPNCHSQTPTWGNKKRF